MLCQNCRNIFEHPDAPPLSEHREREHVQAHHPSLASLQSAARGQCQICLELYTRFQRDDLWQVDQSSGSLQVSQDSRDPGTEYRTQELRQPGSYNLSFARACSKRSWMRPVEFALVPYDGKIVPI